MSSDQHHRTAGEPCLSLRAGAEPEPWTCAALASHADDCVSCAAWTSRRRRSVEALGGLIRRAAPQGLDALVQTEVQRTPLVTLFGELAKHRAPAVLDRLVSEELADPQRAAVRRHLGALPRQVLPAGTSLETRAPRSLRRWSRVAWLSPMVAAAALTVMLLAPRPEGSVGPDATWRPRYQVVEVEHPEALSPIARSLAEGLVGGPLLPAVASSRR
jgi:hypothetical protein